MSWERVSLSTFGNDALLEAYESYDAFIEGYNLKVDVLDKTD